jgi:ATP-dependent helicase HrpB
MSDLPINALLPAIKDRLNEVDELVLEAPPGAGKTTLVPLALLSSPWLADQKIILLEPRRLAARAAAERMASLLGETVGETVGYRIRLESRVSSLTRIEVITEGILARMLQDDPSLEGIGLVIFDEFHERSLDADLGLALCIESRKLFSDLRSAWLKLLVMSATLDGQRITALLGDAPLLRSEGRQYPVNIRYCGSSAPGEHIADRMAGQIVQAWEENTGSILAFLPGQAEIRRCESRLRSVLPASALLCPLYGNLSLAEQTRAVQPPPKGQRKVVLATALAESSLTIEGVSVVVDSGLQRVAVFHPGTGMSRLRTQRLSKASATQRSGRAGRLEPGVCYRLWSEAEQLGLAEQSDAEILQADLASLVLQLLRWGVDEPEQLSWLDEPPSAHYQQALSLLELLGAVDDAGKIRPHGERMAELPTHPRLAHMLLCAADRGHGALDLACDMAALLGERDIAQGAGSDIELRLELLRGERRADRGQQALLQRLRKQSQQFRKLLGSGAAVGDSEISPAELLAYAYPDRIARQQRPGSLDYQLANGRRACLRDGDGLRNAEWLVVAELGGHAGQRSDQIYSAAILSETAFESGLNAIPNERLFCDWDDKLQRFVAERRCYIGEILWRRKPLERVPEARKTEALLALVRQRGLAVLNWSEVALQLRGRVGLLRSVEAQSGFPDMSDIGLLASLEDWLAPYLGPVNSLTGLARLDCEAMLRGLLSWEQVQTLDQQLPTAIAVPSGSKIRIDYQQSPPVLAVKLQEMFGCEETPRLAGGRVPLLIHLLSPARRPLQVTQDLAGFWRGSYQEVKKEMKGRYPKHPWPDDPLVALPTARAKPRR